MDYSPEVRRRFKAPARPGLDEADEAVVVGEAEDRTLNFWVRFRMRVDPSTQRIDRVAYEIFGCPDAMAAADLIAERLEGQPLDAVFGLDVQALASELAIPVEKLGKLLRIEDAVLACHRQVRARSGEGKQ